MTASIHIIACTAVTPCSLVVEYRWFGEHTFSMFMFEGHHEDGGGTSSVSLVSSSQASWSDGPHVTEYKVLYVIPLSGFISFGRGKVAQRM